MYSFQIYNNQETTYIHLLGNSHLINILMIKYSCKSKSPKMCCYNFNVKIRRYSAHELQ